MAWIELHQSLPGHRKTMRLRRALKIGQAQAVGHLCMLWLWCLDNCPDGNTAGLDDCEIAEAAGYIGKDPRVFVDALRTAEFIDPDGCIHDWNSYAGKLIEKREQNAQRMREKRARAEHVQRTCSARADTDAHSENARAQLPYPTVPNRTQPNSTLRENTPIAPGALAPDQPPEPSDPPTPKQPSAQDRRFEEFWSFYPRKVGKGAAAKAYAKIKPDDALHKAILAAIVKAKKSRQWTDDNGQYIPNPATWLNQRRWEDEPDTARASPGGKPNRATDYGQRHYDAGAFDGLFTPLAGEMRSG